MGQCINCRIQEVNDTGYTECHHCGESVDDDTFQRCLECNGIYHRICVQNKIRCLFCENVQLSKLIRKWTFGVYKLSKRKNYTLHLYFVEDNQWQTSNPIVHRIGPYTVRTSHGYVYHLYPDVYLEQWERININLPYIFPDGISKDWYSRLPNMM